MTEVTKDLLARWIPTRKREASKGDFGRLHIWAGSVGYSGAPYFAAEAAVRTGAGLVYLHVPRAIWPVVAGKCNEAMVFPLDECPTPEHFSGADVALLGPGLGGSTAQNGSLRRLACALTIPLVLDADGINAFAGHIDELKQRRSRLTVLTPHEGEFSRLVGVKTPIEDRALLAKHFAQTSGCVLVLKGWRTLTAFPDGTLFVNTTGNPGMAKGGSGDILAGMIAALLGQGLPSAWAVPAAVYLHGRAGDLCAARLGEYGMTPSDLLLAIPSAFPSHNGKDAARSLL